jgi:hypothetical protein
MPRYIFKHHTGATAMETILGKAGTCQFMCFNQRLSFEELRKILEHYDRKGMCSSPKQTKRRTLIRLWQSLEEMLEFDVRRAERKHEELPRKQWWQRSIWG